MKCVTVLAILAAASCGRHVGGSFRVLPAKPEYLLREPDSRVTPFPEVRTRFARLGQEWVELRPRMALRIENAYYQEGAAKRDFASYLGTQLVRYRVRSNGGIRLAEVQSNVVIPRDQRSIPQLIGAARYRHYRFFYEILFNRRAELRGAVLLGAASADELERLTKQLLNDPAAVCSAGSIHCTAFPETCTVSLEMEILVNGVPQNVLWGSSLASVAARHGHVELWRPYEGRPRPVEMDVSDSNALRVPLLPGDQIKWE
jgi:hypothetical protein